MVFRQNTGCVKTIVAAYSSAICGLQIHPTPKTHKITNFANLILYTYYFMQFYPRIHVKAIKRKKLKVMVYLARRIFAIKYLRYETF